MKNRPMQVKFGKIEKIILFGGGAHLVKFAEKLAERGMPFVIFTSERQLTEMIDREMSKKFLDFLNITGYPFVLSEDINTDERLESHLTPRALGISFGAAWIFKASLIKKFAGRLLNYHPTRLPRYRGGAPYSWMALLRERLGAILVHEITSGIDTGRIIKHQEFSYPETCRTPSDYFFYCLEIAKNFFDEFLTEIIQEKDFSAFYQDEGKSVYWPRLNTLENGFIDWQWTGEEIEAFINAFDDPYAGAQTFLNGQKLFLKTVRLLREEADFHPFQAGLIFRITDEKIFVATRGGALRIQKILNDKGEDFLKKMKLGERFYTPYKYLESAAVFRASYNAKGLV